MTPDLFEVEAAEQALLGLTYVSEAVMAQQEANLAAALAGLDLQPFAFRGFVGRRRTASFGWRYDFNGGGFQRAAPLPRVLECARAIVAERLHEPSTAFEQCSVIEYAPGAGIGWHKDRPQFAKVRGSRCSPHAGFASGGLEKAGGSAPR